jgi:hypothetical protein
VECSSQNSRRSARCHLSEMNLTRQRLVTFLRGEMCAAVQQGVEAPSRKREDCRSVIRRYCFECLQIKQAKSRVMCLSGSEVCGQAKNPVDHFFRHFRLFRRSRHEWLCAN